MTRQPTVQVIELAVNPTFSTHWLIPNLHEFTKLHPDIIVNIHSLANNGDFLNREYDAVIMRENFCAPRAEVEYLFDEEILLMQRQFACNVRSKTVSGRTAY